jgi:hypothetical protein
MKKILLGLVAGLTLLAFTLPARAEEGAAGAAGGDSAKEKPAKKKGKKKKAEGDAAGGDAAGAAPDKK